MRMVLHVLPAAHVTDVGARRVASEQGGKTSLEQVVPVKIIFQNVSKDTLGYHTVPPEA